jgi:signal transduction histidine kinase
MARRERGPLVMRPARPVVLAMLIVVLSFAAALVYLQFRLEPVAQRASSVIDHAAPSIQHLSVAQTKLAALGMHVSDYVSRMSESPEALRDEIAGARRQLRVELQAFRDLPEFPGESPLLEQVDGDVAALDRLTAAALEQTDAGDAVAAKRTLHRELQPRVLATSADLSQLRVLNARYASAAAVDILRTRHEAMWIAAGFGAVGLAIAIATTIFLLRLLGSRARLINEHTEILAARATELEAFAGRVAHDLRNPLSAIALRVLAASRRPGIEPRVHEDLDKVAGQIGRMNGIINGLLEFARAGASPEPFASADLGQTLEGVLADVRAPAAEASAELCVDPFPPTRLACTPGALTSVLANLLGNAVKYIGDGERTPRRIVVRVSDRGGGARVEVEDTGPGLPPGAEQRVFEPFRRLNQSKQPGIGLGLATVKKIVEAYRGRIGVETKLGRGSTFWFEMPRAGERGDDPGPPSHSVTGTPVASQV